MKERIRKIITGKKVFTVITGCVLIIFLSFLLIINYKSQIRLQETALVQQIHFLDKQANAISYFYSERRTDLKNISKSRELNIFFENKALGMSMAYGLKASLIQIDKLFGNLIEERKIGELSIYERIVFIDTESNLISEKHVEPVIYDHSLLWKDFFTPDQPEPEVIALRQDGHFNVLVRVPFFFKGEFKGQIFAWINLETFPDLQIRKGEELMQKHIFIDLNLADGASFYPESVPLPIDQIRKADPKKVFRFVFHDSKGGTTDYLAVRIPVPETLFSIVTVMPVSEVAGYSNPRHLLMAMIILAVFVIGAAFLLWTMNARELVLKTRLDEENIRKTEIERKNIELEAEVRISSALEQELKESESKFRTISVTAQDAIIMVNHEGCISFWNRAATTIFGYSTEDVLNRIYYDVIIPFRYHQQYEKLFVEFRTTGKGPAVGRTMEIVAKKKTGEEFPVELSLSAVKLGGNWNAIGIIRDISQRKKNETELAQYRENLELLVERRTKELEQTQKELLHKAVEAGRAQLSAMMLHNIGNAITPVSVNTEILRKNDGNKILQFLLQSYNDLAGRRNDLTSYVTTDPRGMEVAEYMGSLIKALDVHQKKTDAMIQTISAGIDYVAEILSLQRAYAPGRNEMKERVNLNRVIEDALKIQENSILKRNIRLEKTMASHLPHILIEKNKLMQVIINLIKNSFDAIDAVNDKRENKIKVLTYAMENRVGLKIFDTGTGIEKEKLKEIFEFGVSTKGSSGFGLYYCKTFVAANKGTLVLDSPGPGKGATAVMEFLL